MTLIHVEHLDVSMRDLCGNHGPGRIGRVGVSAQSLFLVAVSERDRMNQCVLTGFKSVQFSLSLARAGETDAEAAHLVSFATWSYMRSMKS